MSSSSIDDAGLAAHLRTIASHGPVRLRSGIVSDEYFHKYLFESDPALLRQVSEALIGLLPERVDAVAGLELGSLPLATVISQLSGLPTLFVRKKPKDYGTRRLAEGGEVADRRLAVIEDVVSSGGQLIESCAALGERGADIAAVVCVIDRETGAAENLAAHGLTLRSLWTMSQLRDAAGVERDLPTESSRRSSVGSAAGARERVDVPFGVRPDDRQLTTRRLIELFTLVARRSLLRRRSSERSQQLSARGQSLY